MAALRQAPAAPASRPGRRRPPRGARPDQDRLARTGRQESGPGPRRHGPSGLDRPAPGGRTGPATAPAARRRDAARRAGGTDHGPRRPDGPPMAPERTASYGPPGAAPVGELARLPGAQDTAPGMNEALHGAARLTPPGRAGVGMPRQSGGSYRSPWPAAIGRPGPLPSRPRPRRHPMPGDGTGTLSVFCSNLFSLFGDEWLC